MLLAIDVGNTQIKSAVFEQNTLLQKEIFLEQIIFGSNEKCTKRIHAFFCLAQHKVALHLH